MWCKVGRAPRVSHLLVYKHTSTQSILVYKYTSIRALKFAKSAADQQTVGLEDSGAGDNIGEALGEIWGIWDMGGGTWGDIMGDKALGGERGLGGYPVYGRLGTWR